MQIAKSHNHITWQLGQSSDTHFRMHFHFHFSRLTSRVWSKTRKSRRARMSNFPIDFLAALIVSLTNQNIYALHSQDRFNC